MELVFTVFEIIGTVAFAMSGVFEAVKHRMDLFGVVILGIVTAVGGGVIRDIVIGTVPPVAFVKPIFSLLALLVSLLMFIIMYFLFSHRRTDSNKAFEKWLLFATDTIGLGAFTVSGIATALAKNMNGFALLLFVGFITGTGGGILRDVFCGTIPSIFRKHIYALASIFGAILMIVLIRYIPIEIAMIIGFAGVVIVRILASILKWDLPIVGKHRS